MPARLSLALTYAWCLGLLVAQTASTSTPEELHTFAVYTAFFGRVEAVEILADKSEASGKDRRRLTRAMIRNEAGLTEQEDQMVRTIAKVARAGFAAKQKERGEIIARFKAGNPQATSFTPQVSQQVAALEAQIRRSILDAVEQLRAAMGDVRFRKLDQYVRASIEPHLVTSQGGK